MRHKWLLIVLLLLFSAVFIFAGWNLVEQQLEYRLGETTYAGLEEYVVMPDPTLLDESQSTQHDFSDDETEANVQEEDDTVWPVVDFDALREVNSDIVAWLYLEGTKINYPVVQGTDNNYYLQHMFEGSWNGAGCIFLDSRNEGDFSDRHSIIYGHHMKNGTMFSGLDDYKKQEFYDSHPTILLMTPDQNYKIELFAGYVASVEDNAWELGFTLPEYERWLSMTKEKSCFSSQVEPSKIDQVVTLSTCSYEFDNARFVVVGILR